MRVERYFRRRGELQSLGEILSAAIESINAGTGFYRPTVPAWTGFSKPADRGRRRLRAKLRDHRISGEQLSFDFESKQGLIGTASCGSCAGLAEPRMVAVELKTYAEFIMLPDSAETKSTEITPENPITNEDIPF